MPRRTVYGRPKIVSEKGSSSPGGGSGRRVFLPMAHRLPGPAVLELRHGVEDPAADRAGGGAEALGRVILPTVLAADQAGTRAAAVAHELAQVGLGVADAAGQFQCAAGQRAEAGVGRRFLGLLPQQAV